MSVLIFNLLVIFDHRYPLQLVLQLGFLRPQIQQCRIENFIFLIHKVDPGDRCLPLSGINDQSFDDKEGILNGRAVKAELRLFDLFQIASQLIRVALADQFVALHQQFHDPR